jgi:hypothetical protein
MDEQEQGEPKIGCVNHDCDKCKEQGEPVGEIVSWPDDFSRFGVEWTDSCPPVGAKLYTTPQPKQEQAQGVDWKDMYEKEKRRSAMWIAKYEKDIGPLEQATPQQEQGEPVTIKHRHEWFRTGEMKAGQMRCISCGTWGQEDMPQQRKPLTDEQIYDMYNEPRSDAEMIAFARAIEAAHGIKENT